MDLDYTGLEQEKVPGFVKGAIQGSHFDVSLPLLLLWALLVQLVPCNSGLFCVGCILYNITDSDYVPLKTNGSIVCM